MTKSKEIYSAIMVPSPGTFRLVPEAEFARISDAISRTQFLILPDLGELTIAFLLKHHREARSLTQENLERLSGVGQKHISNIEKGLTTPRWSTLEKLIPHLDQKFEEGVRHIWQRIANEQESA